MKTLRFALAGLVVALQSSAFAAFHFIVIGEVLTGANNDTQIQYVELTMVNANQNFVSGHNWVSRTSTGATLATYTIPSNVTNSAAGSKILLATQAFADLGLVTPDFILPANFLSPNGGQVDFVDSALAGGLVTYAPYTGAPGNGTPIQTNLNSDVLSLTRTADTGNDNADFTNANNTPTNNANQQGTILLNSSVNDWDLY